MATLIAFPILSLITIIQSTIVSRLPLLQGTPDLVLLVIISWALQDRVRTAWQWALLGALMIGFVSILPIIVPVVIYLGITGMTLLVRQRIWETPILGMFIMTFIGSLFSQAVFAVTLSITGTPLPVLDTLKLIILPSLILNLLLATPIFAIIKDLAEWVYPEAIEI